MLPPPRPPAQPLPQPALQVKELIVVSFSLHPATGQRFLRCTRS